MPWVKKRKKDVAGCDKSWWDANDRLESRISEWGNLFSIGEYKVDNTRWSEISQ